MLEDLKIPSAVLVTKVFEHEAHVQREALGLEELGLAVVTHPLSTLTQEQLEERAREGAAQIAAVWLGTNGKG